ncbi:hypothetical protein [endosymbiont 'TC1' of Trimyema compressum]|uniref:hypothetical protein n=1 Tax=endosymbiont 'TC1' of Trimyema compressum TaxID=243899 RepID=UPI0013924130|nr:hypothetical protein [endosymbiont 'TC1' of Trimyema compressum]
MNKKYNFFTIKTRNLIINTLLILLLLNPYKTITVTEVFTFAKIKKQSFYNNFKSKDDVLNNYIDFLK